MGRKKKRKRRRQQPAAAQTPEPSPEARAVSEPSAPAAGDVTSAEATVEPPAAGGQSPSAVAGPSAKVPSPAPAGRPRADDVIVEDLDAALDADAEGVSYESLVAAVAGIDERAPTERPAPPAQGATPEDEAVVEAIDLDDDADPASLDRLIAQVGRTAPSAARKPRPAQTAAEEGDEDMPVIDLDAEPGAPVVRARAPAAAATLPPEVSRLALAAAAGAVDETDPPAIPLDLGDVSTPEARARLLAEALAHAAHKEARYRVPLADERRLARWKSLAASLVLLLAAVVAVAPPAWVRPEPPAQLTAAARARGIRLALLLQAQQVEAYRVRTQELPETLDELPVTLPGIRYTRSARSYQLVAFGPDGEPIVYDATAPSPPFGVLAGAFAHVEDTP